MRKEIQIKVSSADRVRLVAIVANRNSVQEQVWRASVTLMIADGLGTVEIMRWTGKSQPSVWRW